MKDLVRWKTLTILLVLLVLMTFSSCQSTDSQSTLPPDAEPEASAEYPEVEDEKTDIENAEVPEVKPLDMSPQPEEQESQEPQDNFMAQYIGKTVGDVVQDLGGDYTVDGFEGSTMIGYPGNLWFLFGSTEEIITEDLIVRQVIASEQYPAVYGLVGSMTYPEIVEAVGEEAVVPTPDYYYMRIDDVWEYATGFTYRGYNLLYTWLEDPENALSTSVWVIKEDVDALNLNDSPANPEPAKEPEHDDPPDDPPTENPELFCGPGWFYGVMGTKFYVPDGFVQQDITPANGHYYLFRNAEIDMSISIHEVASVMIGIEDSSAMSDEYASRADKDGVTYATSGDNFYVVSGYYDPDENSTIYYDRVDYDDTFRYEVDFQYPASRAEEGKEILLEFLRNYSHD